MASSILNGKLQQEFQTITAMVKIYCKAHCDAKGKIDECEQCSSLLKYAETRLDRCPYGQQKPTCNKCPVHCYKPELKAKVREVMKYAGPRMLLVHPVIAIRHLLADCCAEEVGKPPAAASNRHIRLEKEKSNP